MYPLYLDERRRHWMESMGKRHLKGQRSNLNAVWSQKPQSARGNVKNGKNEEKAAYLPENGRNMGYLEARQATEEAAK